MSKLKLFHSLITIMINIISPVHHGFTRLISHLKTIIALSCYEKYNISNNTAIAPIERIEEDILDHEVDESKESVVKTRNIFDQKNHLYNVTF